MYKAYLAQSLTAKIGQNVVDRLNGIGDVVNKVYDLEIGKAANKLYHMAKDNSERLEKTAPLGKVAGQSVSDGSYLLSYALQNERYQNKLAAAAVLGGAMPNIYSDLSQLYAKIVAAPHNTGGNTPDYLTSNRLKGFWFMHRTIRREFAEIIDQFFDRYGYACHKTKIPNIHVRTNWTYTKTKGCQVSGNIPTEAITDIQQIFDNGITFWTNAEHFGDYSLPNNIIT